MSTWGQLRLLLQQDFGGISPDLIDGYLNTRYGDVLDRWPWKGLEVETILQTTAAYQTGTVSLTQGLNTATGTGTVFTPAMTGMRFQALTDNTVYTFTFVSATAGTLDRNYEGTTNAAATFWIYQDQYPLPAGTKTVLSVVNPVTGLPLEDWTKGQTIEGLSTWSGFPQACPQTTPQAYALAADTNENTPPVYHTLQLYPPPATSAGYPVRYQKATAGFSSPNTNAGPLPWISDNVLLCGCRADGKKKNKDYAGAALEEAAYERAIRVMLNVDGARRGLSQPRTAPVYANYRLRRVLR